jgi:DNA-binding winged helix-turn-helix (wHTH) protein/Tol biopolymer transport system component
VANPENGTTGYRFGVFEVDLRSGELRKHGLKIKFQDQPFKVLTMLLERAPDVVSREELRKKLWSEDTFVDFDHSLSIAINKVREALRDSSDFPRYVETLPKRGYRFIAPVETVRGRRSEAIVASVAGSAGEADVVPDDLVFSERAGSGDREAEKMLSGTLPAPSGVDEEDSAAPARRRSWTVLGIAGAVVLAVAVGYRLRTPAANAPPVYRQLTNFTDAAFAPAISPDGRMLVFLRGDAGPFMSLGQVYIKLLPNGEPVQLTKDPRLKFAPTFSPDGTQINYTTTDPVRWGWDTVSVSALGGEPSAVFVNASALTWMNERQILFAKVKTGLHMGIATASESRTGERDIYFPEHERAMATVANASPDGKWILVVEKDQTSTWLPCRVVPFDGSSSGRQVGPRGQCTAADWSPDGSMIYLTASVDGQSHLWRQRFPEGIPEQMTYGPLEETGVAVAPDGSGLITSIGSAQGSLWIRSGANERQISSEGFPSRPRFSTDGRTLYFLLRRESSGSANELWATDVGTGKNRAIIQTFSIESYDVSADGTAVVFGTEPVDGRTEIWIAAADNSTPPVKVSSSGADIPYWGPDGDLLFRKTENNRNYLFRMKRDGSGQRRVSEQAINQVSSVSPDRRWVTAPAPAEGSTTAVVAISTEDGSARKICFGICMATWSRNMNYFYFRIEDNSDAYRGKVIAIPIPPGAQFPDLPPLLNSMEQAAQLPGSVLVDRINSGPVSTPGPDPSIWAYTQTTEHRNLFWIPLK